MWLMIFVADAWLIYVIDVIKNETIFRECRCQHRSILNINTLTLGAVWQYLHPGADTHASLSTFLAPVASNLPFGDVLKNTKAVI